LASDDICKVRLTNVRLSFPHLFKARGFGSDDNGSKAYSGSFLIPKDTKDGDRMIADIEDAIEEAKFKEFGKKVPKIKSDNVAYKDGDDEGRPESEGYMVVPARNNKRPRVLDRDKTDLTEEDGVIYAGCYVDAIVRFWAQKYEGIPRVNCSLEGVRFRRDGDAFGAAPLDPDEFEDLDGDEDDDDRGSRRNRRSRDDDEDDDRGSRRNRRSRDEDEDEEDDRGSRRSRRSRDEDDEDDTSSRRRKRSRDDDEDDDRGASRRRRSRDEDDDEDDDRGSRRSRRSRDDEDEDDDEDRPPRSSRNNRRRNRDI
jgi:hypothetical protein